MFRTLRTAQLFKEMAIFMVLPMLIIMIAPACSQKKATESAPESENNFQSLEANAQLHETWIQRMDPYVSQNTNGTYAFDSTGFATAYSSLSDADQTVVTGFIESIPVVNAKIVSGELDNMTCGSACWNYWWGRRCCYWGSTAYVAIGIMQVGGLLAGFVGGVYFIAMAMWATYLNDNYGGFCLNITWACGPVCSWLTRP